MGSRSPRAPRGGGVARWRNYPEVLEQCHFVVINRPGTEDLSRILAPFSDRVVNEIDAWTSTGGTVLPLTIPPLAALVAFWATRSAALRTLNEVT